MKVGLAATVCFLFAFGRAERSCKFAGNATAITKSICLPNDYLKEERPDTHTKVGITFKILGIPSIQDHEKTITLELELVMSWMDNRIVTKSKHSNKFETISPESSGMFWQPYLYITNLVKFKALKVIRPINIMIISSKKIVGNMVKSRVTISCPMNFDRFPMDRQSCKFLVTTSSEKFPNIQMRSSYTWVSQNGSSMTDTAVYIPKIEELELTEQGKREMAKYNTTSVVGFTITLKRRSMPYFLQYYLPAIAIVILSQMSFLISPQQLPGRVALLVTLFLVLTNIFINQQVTTPPSEKITNLGEYLLSCLFFVFAALLEFAFVLKQKRIADLKSPILPLQSENDKSGCSLDATIKQQQYQDSEKFSAKIDVLAQVIFAIAFALFNLVYWTKSLV